MGEVYGAVYKGVSQSQSAQFGELRLLTLVLAAVYIKPINPYSVAVFVPSKIGSLVDRAQDAGIDITTAEVWNVVEKRVDEAVDPATHSWIHLNNFRKFELHGRCFPWTTETELRTAVAELPSLTPWPEWEARDEFRGPRNDPPRAPQTVRHRFLREKASEVAEDMIKGFSGW